MDKRNFNELKAAAVELYESMLNTNPETVEAQKEEVIGLIETLAVSTDGW